MPTAVAPITVEPVDLDALASYPGRIAIFVSDSGQLDQLGRRVNRKTRGAVERFADGEGFSKMKEGDAKVLLAPSGLSAEALIVVKLERRAELADARKAGAAIAKLAGDGEVLVGLGPRPRGREIVLGLLLRSYAYTEMKSEPDAPGAGFRLMASRPDDLAAVLDELRAVAEGVFFARDLTWAPANVLTTTRFAEELEALGELGVAVEVLDEPQLEDLGMRLLLGVGQGSESPSKVVVMRWEGAKGAPLALVGKGVVFDTGGISLKPGAGMEEMTMDMGGAAVVSGVMKTLAMRKAPAHVVGLVGLVENMPDGRAQRPGDVVTSMKGDTVEVINTDAEGRLVLADVLWYAQERFKPQAMIDLATLTGAVIVALGHENAGVFANDDGLAKDFLAAAGAEGEGAWRMPLGPGYAKLLKSPVADLKNIGGRWGGSVTAAEFLRRFVPDDLPWLHLDIAGVARTPGETALAPKGVTGWGVRALDRLVRDRFEADAD